MVCKLGEGVPPVGCAKVVGACFQLFLTLPELLPSVGFHGGGVHVQAVALPEHHVEGVRAGAVDVVGGEVGPEPVLEAAESGGCVCGGGFCLLGFNVVVAEEMGQAGFEEGEGAVALSDGPLRPGCGGGVDVVSCLLEESVYGVHPLDGGLQSLTEGSEGATKERKHAEYRLSRIEGRISAVEMGGLELPLLNLQEPGCQSTVNLLRFRQALLGECSQVFLKQRHL